MSDPNIQTLVAFGVVAVISLLGLAAKVMIGRSKVTKDRPSATGDLF